MAGVDWQTVERQHAEELAAAWADHDAARAALAQAQTLEAAYSARAWIARALLRLEQAEHAE